MHIFTVLTINDKNMKNTNRITQTHFSIDLPETIENYLVLTFSENESRSTHFIKLPDWWRFYDKKNRYYIFSRN